MKTDEPLRLYEWDTAKHSLSDQDLCRFEQYLHEVWRNRQKFDIEENSYWGNKPLEEQKQQFFQFGYDHTLQARNYVGVVQFEGLRIQVLPKIIRDRNLLNAQLQQRNLLFWLSYCQRIRFPFGKANAATLEIEDTLELILYVFANLATEVLSNQPMQAYQQLDETTGYMKGQLNMPTYIRNQLSTGRWHEFSCTHAPFVYDNLFNRIVKQVAQRLRYISNHSFNQNKLGELLFLLDEVSNQSVIAADCDKVSLNALQQDHSDVLQMCRLLLSNQVMDLDDDQSRNFCFLLPMEVIFEDFIAGFIEAHFPEWRFTKQASDYLATIEGKPIFQIRNDLYFPNRLIVDTKYKTLHPSDEKFGISQADMYQMVAYAAKRGCHQVLLLYPQSEAKSFQAHFEVKSPLLEYPIQIQANSIAISFENLEDAAAQMNHQLKQILSPYLVSQPIEL